jgi:hypothetical protein
MASGGIQTFRLKQQIGARSAGADVVIVANYKELYDMLKDLGQKSPLFDKELRKASQAVAQHVVDRAVVNANGQPPHGTPRDGSSGHSQASQVVRGLRARRDRIPTIKLDHNRLYKSGSRSNKSRTQNKAFGPRLNRPVTFGDVFFGAEFGGRRRKTTQQFLRHRGRQGYFFWQAVRDSRSFIAKEYVLAIDDIAAMLGISPK